MRTPWRARTAQIAGMPKTLVLLLSDDPALAARARRVADGARQVRFAEVDVRRDGDPTADPRLTTADYDALVVGVPGDGATILQGLLGRLGAGGALTDHVGAAFAADDAACWAALRALGAHGLLLVPATTVPPTAAAAVVGSEAADRELGRRVATVAAWVRHARSHEHAAEHAHPHASPHHHHHAPPHPHAPAHEH